MSVGGEGRRAAAPCGSALAIIQTEGRLAWLADSVHTAFLADSTAPMLDRIGGAVILARAAEDCLTERRLLHTRMLLLDVLGRHEEAAAEGERLEQDCLAAGDSLGLADVEGNLVPVLLKLGQLEEALDALARGVAIVGTSQARSSQACRAMLAISTAASTVELYEMAAEQLERGEAIARRTGDHLSLLLLLSNAAFNQLLWAIRLELVGKADEARRHYLETVRIAARSRAALTPQDGPQWWADSEVAEGYAWAAMGEPELAGAILRPLAEQNILFAMPENDFMIYTALARVERELGNVDTARHWLDRALAVDDQTLSRTMRSATLVELEHLDACRGRGLAAPVSPGSAGASPAGAAVGRAGPAT